MRIANHNSNLYLNGSLDEFRISKGVARWTSDFTLTTNRGHFENASGSGVTIGKSNDTQLLIHSDAVNGSSIFEDSSVYSREISANGNVRHST